MLNKNNPYIIVFSKFDGPGFFFDNRNNATVYISISQAWAQMISIETFSVIIEISFFPRL